MYKKCPHCGKTLPNPVDMCKQWLSELETLNGVTAIKFCEEFGISWSSFHQYYLRKHGASWNRMLHDERVLRYEKVKSMSKEVQMKALGMSERSLRRWRQKMGGE